MTQVPVDGHYFWNLFPALVLSGVGLAFSFVPVTIAGLTGVRREDAGVASGLINASRQVGGAIGLAAVTTIAADYTVAGGGPAAVDGGLTQGYQVGFLALTLMALRARSSPPCCSARSPRRRRSSDSTMNTQMPRGGG